MNNIILLLSFIIGFFLLYKINYIPNMYHENIRQELILYIQDSSYHIHHWITFSLFLFFIFIGKYLKNEIILSIIVGTFLGFIVEGFLFKDRFNIKLT